MIPISITALHRAASNKKVGYLDACFKAGTIKGGYIYFSMEEYNRIRLQFNHAASPMIKPGGAGTELKKLLAKAGIVPAKNCQCNKRARLMDANGAEWCRNNMDMIVGWLREEAARAGLPFSSRVAAWLVKRAIHNYEQTKQNTKHN